MPGFLLHVGAGVICAHAGQAQATMPNPRVSVSAQATVTQPPLWTIAGCAMPPPPSGNGPCVTAQWLTASTRVTSNGQPLLLLDSQSLCTPTATPLIVVATQTRVSAM